MATKLYVNLNAKSPRSAIVQSETVLTPVSAPEFVLSDSLPIEVYLCDGLGGFVDPSTYTMALAVGTPADEPTSGTYTITIAGVTSAAIAYNATAAQLQSALAAMASVGTNNVQVSGEFPTYTIEFIGSKANTDIGSASFSSETLYPRSGVFLPYSRNGGGGYNEVWVMQIQRIPLVLKSTWSTTSTKYYGNVNLATRELAEELSGEGELTSYLEIQLTASGQVLTAVQSPCVIRSDVNTNNSITPVDLIGAYTESEADAQFVQNQSGITSLTGGGTGKLDGITTTTLNAGILAVTNNTSWSYFYRLNAGDSTESSPTIIRPDDFALSTNEKIWNLQGIAVAGVSSLDGAYVSGFAGRTEFSKEILLTAVAAPSSPVNGDTWQDSTQKCLRSREAGISQYLTGCIFTQTANKQITNTTDETSAFGTGVGTLTLPANFWVAGKTVRVRIRGDVAQAVSTGTVTWKVKLGSVVLGSLSYSTQNLTTQTLKIDALITCRTTGASGTFAVAFEQAQGGSATALGSVTESAYETTGAATADTTASAALDVTVTHSSASASNTENTYTATVEVLA